ncbi:copper chaperone PCu(A)C [Lysobacter silvisoli]|uniref:Copper chaperone PCu(A)C n=2 Tax=Lysobacter silvisoli TaxID=2293254 RepID=A0A371K4Y9_9GAMM|nr:copper chaperone PCu(A)C [Lysobacter silvisoli]
MLVFALIALAFLAACSRAPQATVGDIAIERPWVRAMAPGAPAAGGFAALTNTGDRPDRLVSASTPDAQRVEIHEMRMDQDVMRMRQLADGLPLPTGTRVELKPGSYHLMLVSPKRRFMQGERVTIELRFERAGKHQVVFPVKPMLNEDGGDDHH